MVTTISRIHCSRRLSQKQPSLFFQSGHNIVKFPADIWQHFSSRVFFLTFSSFILHPPGVCLLFADHGILSASLEIRLYEDCATRLSEDGEASLSLPPSGFTGRGGEMCLLPSWGAMQPSVSPQQQRVPWRATAPPAFTSSLAGLHAAGSCVGHNTSWAVGRPAAMSLLHLAPCLGGSTLSQKEKPGYAAPSTCSVVWKAHAKAALGQKTPTSPEGQVTLSDLLKLYSIGHPPRSHSLSFTKAPGKEDCNTRMSQLSQGHRRTISLLLVPAPPPRSAGLLSALCCPTIQARELNPLRTQRFIWPSAVKRCLIARDAAANEGVPCFWKLSESVHWFMYVLGWSLIAGEILTGCTCCPPFSPSTKILVYKDLFPFKSFFWAANRADPLLFKVKYHCTFIYGSHSLPLAHIQACLVPLWMTSQVSPQQKNAGRLFVLLPKEQLLISGFFFL